ncbi:MAG: endo alpha-1,4 polygalactosaminidase [Acidobacteria bacterium]|nr:endo alpha-1,4 polygalactosaminidase [Acidobacteriota bacterium]
MGRPRPAAASEGGGRATRSSKRTAVAVLALLGALLAIARGRPAPAGSGAQIEAAPLGGASAGAVRAPDLVPWPPKPGTTWQIQFSGRIDTTVPAQVFDFDGFDTAAALVDEVHATGRRVVCYLNAGGWENWRPDKESYPESVLGKPLDDWPGERWVDVRQRDALRPILEARADMCRSKGFDGIEWDNVDGFDGADTGFPLTGDDQLAFNRMLSEIAHDRGLAVGLKNDLGQIPELIASFDFAINEQCFEYEECEDLRPFAVAGKAVFHIEYGRGPLEFCPRTLPLGLSSIQKRLDLDAWRRTCAVT